MHTYYFIFQCVRSNVTGSEETRQTLVYTLKKRLKITQLEKARYIKVNELKLTQDEIF